ncbi:MAG: Zn-ribbon domain-containing OB-fold protein [Chloroflexota bacterium]
MVARPGGTLSAYRDQSGAVTIPLPGSTLEVPPVRATPIELAGVGAIVSYTVVGVPSTRFKDIAPYALAVVELEEGARLLALVDGANAGDLFIGARVQYLGKDDHGHHFALT